MESFFKSSNIIQSFKILTGNTRISVVLEPLWGIPFVLYTFYLSLYMKDLGITDKQIGYLISIGFVFGTVFSLFSGIITDKLGRKRTTLIFDLICWPLAIAVYVISNNFWMFALATVINSSVRIVSVSWSLMVVEDADNDQRASAFNLINIINLSTGIITPLAGILVGIFGTVKAERAFMVFAIISMTLMMLIRNHFYKETKMGKQILEEQKGKNFRDLIKNGLYRQTFMFLRQNPSAVMLMLVTILFNVFIILGSISSLYFAPYMTEVLKIGKSEVSVLGAINSVVLLIIFIFVNPIISRYNVAMNMAVGSLLQALSMILLIVIPNNSLLMASSCIVFYSIGFGMFRPYMDSLLAEVTDGKERAGIYSLTNTATTILSAVVGFASGYMYTYNPKLIYIASVFVLTLNAFVLILYMRSKSKQSTFPHIT